MLRRLHLVAILIALSLGWMSSASASQQVHEARFLRQTIELQQGQTATAVQYNPDLQHNNHLQQIATDPCQDNGFQNHCVGCGVTVDSPDTASMPPASMHSPLPQLLSIALFADLIDYPPKPLS